MPSARTTVVTTTTTLQLNRPPVAYFKDPVFNGFVLVQLLHVVMFFICMAGFFSYCWYRFSPKPVWPGGKSADADKTIEGSLEAVTRRGSISDDDLSDSEFPSNIR